MSGPRHAACGRCTRVKRVHARGLCRNCSLAHITRREYSEIPVVICTGLFDRAHRVPLDIKECSSFKRRGELSLHQMHDMAMLVDDRDAGGQYL